MNTGIIFTRYPDTCHLKKQHQSILDFSLSLPEVKLVWEEEILETWDDFIKDIIENHIEKIIIAGIGTGFLKNRITSAMVKAGQKPQDVYLADYEDHGLNGSLTISMVKSLIFFAIKGIPIASILKHEATEMVTDTLVIGGGIAGIQAALDIAASGHKVFLVEKTGTIGGHMAMFDKTFPTLDCAACILTPKMVEVGQHSHIALLTYSEVVKLEGEPGNYRVTVHKKARRVDVKKCIGCGICAEKCPSRTRSDFDAGTAMRKAIYIPFPQAVPNKYLIDADSCRYVQEGKCGVCAKVCPADCINLDEKDSDIILNVGNIVLATGFNVFDARKAEQFGYGKYPNVITSLELERLLNASGPTGGNIRFRREDKKGQWLFTIEGEEPSRIALIHCIGSRDHNHNNYCSRVCCMYSLKMAHLIKEKLPESSVFEFFIDMRAYGKGYEEFYERIKTEGVHCIRGKASQVLEKEGQLIIRAEDILNGKLLEIGIDMVVLSVGLEPSEKATELAKTLGIPQDQNGWYMESCSVDDTQSTYASGIFIAGACQGPKDIPDSVTQGSAAAAAVLRSIIKKETRKGFKDLTLDTHHSEVFVNTK